MISETPNLYRCFEGGCQVNPIWYFVFYTILVAGGPNEAEFARSRVYHFRDQEVCNTFRAYEVKRMSEKLPKGSAFGYSLKCRMVKFEGEKK